jgi:hypothetical protein
MGRLESWGPLDNPRQSTLGESRLVSNFPDFQSHVADLGDMHGLKHPRVPFVEAFAIIVAGSWFSYQFK